MEPDIQRLNTSEIDQELIDGYFGLSLIYAKNYSNDPKNFLTCFVKFKSIRMACSWIVWGYKKSGIFKDCTGDFSEWANRQKVDDKWKPVLNDVLKIIFSIVKS